MKRLLIAGAALAACTGDTGPAGPQGPQGTPGQDGDQGDQGEQGDPGTTPLPDHLRLPGAHFAPESIHAAADGTLYVGSLLTGQIVKFAPGATTHTEFKAAGAGGIIGVAGVLVDEGSNTLWICSVDPAFQQQTQLVALNLATAAVKTAYNLPNGAGAFCNDIALDGANNVYVADSFGTIARLPAGGTALSTWATDDDWIPGGAFQFMVDGIVWDGGTNIYVNMLETGELYRVPIASGGAAGTVQLISLEPGLWFPDGMRRVNATTFLVVEAIGRLSRITISGNTGTTEVITNRLDQPTSLVVVGTNAWVTEGQIQRIFGGEEDPLIPYLVQRVPL
jgi:hypothetical protein